MAKFGILKSLIIRSAHELMKSEDKLNQFKKIKFQRKRIEHQKH